jgi:hypothetical protein
MKTKIYGALAVGLLILCLNCCSAGIFHENYTLVMPILPGHWVSLLGEPVWNIVWVNSEGVERIKTFKHTDMIEIEIPQTWISAVVASPYWPEKEINQNLFMPAGAIFPYDVSGNFLHIRWVSGHDAVFFWEMVMAARQFEQEKGTPRLPTNFNWPRFRELFESDVLNEKLKNDPWLANWRYIAEKTVQVGFDRRRLVPEPYKEVVFPVSSGPWYGSSPFAAPLFFEEGKPIVFPVRDRENIWISREGILRCNQNAWVFIPMYNSF